MRMLVDSDVVIAAMAGNEDPGLSGLELTSIG